MRTFNNYEEVRHAFVEGEINRQEFETLARDVDGYEMLRVERKFDTLADKAYRLMRKLTG